MLTRTHSICVLFAMQKCISSQFHTVKHGFFFPFPTKSGQNHPYGYITFLWLTPERTPHLKAITSVTVKWFICSQQQILQYFDWNANSLYHWVYKYCTVYHRHTTHTKQAYVDCKSPIDCCCSLQIHFVLIWFISIEEDF